MREASVSLRAGLETPARPIRVLEVRGIRSSNRADSLPAGVRSRERVGASAAVDQARPGRQGPLARVHGVPTALRQRDGISSAAAHLDTRRSGLRVLARTASRGQGDRVITRPLPTERFVAEKLGRRYGRRGTRNPRPGPRLAKLHCLVSTTHEPEDTT